MERKSIIYLYSEIMPYNNVVMKALVQHFDVSVTCICWDRNKRTPFVPQDSNHITFHKRSAYDRATLVALIGKLKPALILVSGRMDRLYLQVAKHFRQLGFKTVGLSDNQWTGSRKNRIAAILAPWLYRQYFTYMWVAGQRQYLFARRMGYGAREVITGFLSADVDLFASAFASCKATATALPHSFVYVGRFVAHKGISMLIEAFRMAKKNTGSDWKLVLVGSGEISEKLAGNDIEVVDFMSSEDLAAASCEWGVFCLPSIREPWGVVVHEFAAAGLPLVSAASVGAADAFVISGYNGFIFETGKTASLCQCLTSIMMMDNEELCAMSARSHEIAQSVTPVKAAYRIMSIV